MDLRPVWHDVLPHTLLTAYRAMASSTPIPDTAAVAVAALVGAGISYCALAKPYASQPKLKLVRLFTRSGRPVTVPRSTA
jgi:hypothetical protein